MACQDPSERVRELNSIESNHLVLKPLRAICAKNILDVDGNWCLADSGVILNKFAWHSSTTRFEVWSFHDLLQPCFYLLPLN